MTDNRSGTAIRRDRFSDGPARSFLSSMEADEHIFAADLAVDRAHVVMLVEQDIVPPDDGRAILDALAAIENAGYAGLPDAEDVHEAIETAVIDRVGEAGGRMHTARSRNDEVTTCIRIALREELLAATAATLVLREVLLEGARDHLETVMPGFTHLQPAQPTTVAHYLASYEQAVARDTARLFDAFERVNCSPLGAAAFAGTPFPIDRERTAALLGFDGMVVNAMDAASSRDYLIESAGAVAALATTISGLAEDGIIFANRGFLRLDDAYASTSSIMPQKKNPDTLELSRGMAGTATGTLTGLLTRLKGLPRAYNRDLQGAHPDVLETVAAVAEATRVVAGALETATWDAHALATAADEGGATATGVADLLAANGVPFRTAHEVIASAAASGTLTVASIATAASEHLGDPLDDFVDRTAVATALDPTASVASRDSVGGPAPDAVRPALEQARAVLAADREDHETRERRLATAAEDLAREVTAIG